MKKIRRPSKKRITLDDLMTLIGGLVIAKSMGKSKAAMCEFIDGMIPLDAVFDDTFSDDFAK